MRLLRGARRRRTQVGCSSLPTGTQMTSACRQDHTPARRCLRNKVAAMVKLRLIEQACGCSMLRGGGGLKVRARVETVHAAATRHIHVQCVCSGLLQWSCHAASTGRASGRCGCLTVRSAGGLRVRAQLLTFNSRVQSDCRRDQAHAMCSFCNGAAMKLRLVEQACGCSKVRGGDGLKVRARHYP